MLGAVREEPSGVSLEVLACCYSSAGGTGQRLLLSADKAPRTQRSIISLLPQGCARDRATVSPTHQALWSN